MILFPGYTLKKKISKYINLYSMIFITVLFLTQKTSYQNKYPLFYYMIK